MSAFACSERWAPSAGWFVAAIDASAQVRSIVWGEPAVTTELAACLLLKDALQPTSPPFHLPRQRLKVRLKWCCAVPQRPMECGGYASGQAPTLSSPPAAAHYFPTSDGKCGPKCPSPSRPAAKDDVHVLLACWFCSVHPAIACSHGL
eukprot:1057563-Rhodomonas_salina.3